MLISVLEYTETLATTAVSDVGDLLDVGSLGGSNMSCLVDVQDDTPSPTSFDGTAVNTADDTIDLGGPEIALGLVGQFTTTNTLPAGLSLLTNYYLIPVAGTTKVKVATSLVNAQTGTAVNITSTGTGTHTFTATALAASISFIQSNSTSLADADWPTVGSATNITASSITPLSIDRPPYRYYKVLITMTSGQLSASKYYLVKGDR